MNGSSENRQLCSRWSTATRGLGVFARLTPFALAFMRDRRRFLLFGGPAKRTATDLERRAVRLVGVLAELGPVFVKLGQAFASRSDLVPEPYLGALSSLVDHVPPLPEGLAEAVIQAELGCPVDDVFVEFDPAPVAAASFGQVHRARYRDRAVAVKVLRPGVEQIVRRDLRLAGVLAAILAHLFRSHWTRALIAAIREFQTRVWDETDLRTEAQNARALARQFQGDPRVVIPRVVPELTRSRVLVLEFVRGTRVDQLHGRFHSGDLCLKEVVRTIADLYLQMLIGGTFHADPHPGNLLVDGEGRVVLLDFGMVVEIDQDLRTRLLRAFLAVGRQDVDGVVDALLELGALDPAADRNTVKRAARRILSLTSMATDAPREAAIVLQELLRTLRDVPLLLPAELVYLVRAAILVDGIGTRYDPGFNVLAMAKDTLARGHQQLALAFLGDVVDPNPLDWAGEAFAAIRSARSLLGRLEREELRVRARSSDLNRLALMTGVQIRRALLLALLLAAPLQAGVSLVLTRRPELLQLGAILSAGIITVVLALQGRWRQNGRQMSRSGA